MPPCDVDVGGGEGRLLLVDVDAGDGRGGGVAGLVGRPCRLAVLAPLAVSDDRVGAGRPRPDSASAQVKVTVTGPVYQPLCRWCRW